MRAFFCARLTLLYLCAHCSPPTSLALYIIANEFCLFILLVILCFVLSLSLSSSLLLVWTAPLLNICDKIIKSSFAWLCTLALRQTKRINCYIGDLFFRYIFLSPSLYFFHTLTHFRPYLILPFLGQILHSLLSWCYAYSLFIVFY